jgi:limonene-1,2-epoxide hydrolase
MGRIQVERWVEALRSAWELRDATRVGALFTEGAVYQPNPLGETLHGREAIIAHWAGELSTQDGVEVSMGRPLVDGDRVAVEWWAVVTSQGRQTTDCGALLLEFDDERCGRLWEYWMLGEGRIEPAEGWGGSRAATSR